MSDYHYILYGQIQDFKAKQFARTGKTYLFPEVMKILEENGQVQYGDPATPDFLSWDCKDTESFRQLVWQIPSDISLLEQMSIQKDSNGAFHLISDANVGILIESCYAAPAFSYVDCFTVMYVMQGSCVFHSKTTPYHMKQGELCVIPPRFPFFVSATEKDLVVTIQAKEHYFQENFFMILRYNTILSSFFRRALLEDQTECKFFFLPPDMHLFMLIRQLFTECMIGDAYYCTAFYNYMQLFFLCIIRSTETTYNYYSAEKHTSPDILMPAILEYISQHYRTITLQHLSDHFHYSCAYMSRLVLRLTGCSYQNIVRDLKLKEAKNLLLNTNLSVSSISQKCGFGCADTLTRAFRKMYHKTPSEYRTDASVVHKRWK